MWFKEEVLYRRLSNSFLWTLLLQELFLSTLLLAIKFVIWNPFSSIGNWLFHMFHWKTLIYQIALCLTTVMFGILNLRFYSVEKVISSTRFEKICKSLSPHCLQHILATTILGSIVAYCCTGSIYNNDENSRTYMESFLTLNNGFEYSFIVGYGCYTGVMFSLKYFICNMYLVKFTLDQKLNVNHIKLQIFDILKDSITNVLKETHWYYLMFIFIGSFFNNSDAIVSDNMNSNESILYRLISIKLLLFTFIIGIVIFFNFSLYICIFNTLISQPFVFPIEVPLKGNKDKILSKALCSDCNLLKYLATLDLRLLSQFDLSRRQIIFSISHPGGHPHHWKSISDICIRSLQSFISKFYECSMNKASARINFKSFSEKSFLQQSPESVPNVQQKIFSYIRERPVVSYFFDEYPNAKLMKLFSTAQPYIWMIEALGHLVSASYNEDKYGVVQSSLQQIICLLLDIKMAEEKMPFGIVGIRTYVKDPQGRYEHIHQRMSLKSSVHGSLCKIAATFQKDANGIYLTPEYQKYFQRYLKQINS